MIERTLFREEHHIFRESVRRFVEREIVPFHAQWERDGVVPRELWLKAGAEGLLCCTVPEQYGGPGLDYCSTTSSTRSGGGSAPAARAS
jgi:alkylation response protein AidB-like acyl-CoA dehydrogenase